MKSINQLTLRGFSEELARILKEKAHRNGISLNRAAIRLMRKGAGLRDPGDEPETIGPLLDKYAGTWTLDEARLVDNLVEELDQVPDRDFWK